MENFEVKGCLGKGAYGKIFWVLEKATGKEYALKVMNKPDNDSNNFLN